MGYQSTDMIEVYRTRAHRRTSRLFATNLGDLLDQTETGLASLPCDEVTNMIDNAVSEAVDHPYGWRLIERPKKRTRS